MPAKMPAKFIRSRVKDLGPGNSGYIDAEYISVDSDCNVHINLNALVKDEPGTRGVLVANTPKGLALDMTGCQCTFEPGPAVDPADTTFEPACEITCD